MTSESRTAIWVGIGATLAIAAIKFVAAQVTGSSAMLAEGVHSLVDTSDGLLLLLGLYRSRRPPDENHPFGHGQELYFWTLLVAIVFFAVGGGVSIYEGVQHMLHPHPMEAPLWNYAVLAAAFVFTVGSFVVAYRSFRRTAPEGSLFAAARASKDPTLFTLVYEDLADMAGIVLAAAGIFLSRLLDAPVLDGLASVLVGLLLSAVAVFLARESRGLLTVEGARSDVVKAVRAVVSGDAAVRAVHRPVAVNFGPQTVMVGLGVEFDTRLRADEVAGAIDRIEREIRRARPEVRYIYVEAESVAQPGPGPGDPDPRTRSAEERRSDERRRREGSGQQRQL